jgi:hypothetical protein
MKIQGGGQEEDSRRTGFVQEQEGHLHVCWYQAVGMTEK